MPGKMAIVGMLLVAGCLAVFGWWWRYEQANQASAWWGNRHIHAILAPESATIFRVHPVETSSESTATVLIEFQDTQFQGENPVEITNARGFLHARHSLTQDISFEWQSSLGSAPQVSHPQWQYGLRLSHKGQTTTLLFDFEQRWLGIVEEQKLIRLVEHTNRGWQSYLERTLGTTNDPQASATGGR